MSPIQTKARNTLLMYCVQMLKFVLECFGTFRANIAVFHLETGVHRNNVDIAITMLEN